MIDLESLQAELTIAMGEIDALCGRYGYEAIPTLLLRHSKGASSSILLGNDSLGKVVMCIAELGQSGNESSESPAGAALKLFTGGR